MTNAREILLVVDSVPLLNAYSDFTDECYYCHSLNYEITEQMLKDGSAHLHSHVCDADCCNINTLTSAQKKNLNSIRLFLNEN